MKKELKGVIYAVVAGACWGLNGVAGNYLFEGKGLTAVWLVTLRLLASGICILGWMWHKKGSHVLEVWKQKKTAVDQLILGLCGVMLCQLTYFLAIQHSNAGIATALHYVSPALVMLFCLCVEKRKPEKLEVIVLLAVCTGVFLIATHGDLDGLVITPLALFFGLASAVFLSMYNIQPKKLLQKFGLLETVGWGMLIGGLVMTPIVKLWEVPGSWDWQTVLLMAWVIVFGTMIPYIFYLKGVQLIGSVKASMFSCVEPVVSMLMSALLLGKVFGKMDLLGMCCILGGVIALTVWGKKE